MDGNRFDALAKTLIAATSRRRTLSGLLGGTLGLLGLADPDGAWSAKSGRCKKKCDECEKCQKGKCRKTKSGKKRCKKGKCQPKANGTPCFEATGACQNGRCVCPSGREECPADPGRCIPVCGPGTTRNPLTCGCCQTTNQTCTPLGANSACCSGACAPGVPPNGFCAGRAAGEDCSFGAQCQSGVCNNQGQCA